MFASPARSSNKQTPTDHTDDWKNLLDFREKIQNALEAGEITEEEYDQFQKMADQMENELQGLSGAEFAHSYADDDTLDNSNISNENSKTRNSTRGENYDNRRVREGTEEDTRNNGLYRGTNPSHIENARASAEWRDQPASVQRVVTIRLFTTSAM